MMQGLSHANIGRRNWIVGMLIFAWSVAVVYPRRVARVVLWQGQKGSARRGLAHMTFDLADSGVFVTACESQSVATTPP